MTDRLAALLPYPASARLQPGSFPLSADTPIAAGPGAPRAAAAVRRVLAALPWPPGARHGTARRPRNRPRTAGHGTAPGAGHGTGHGTGPEAGDPGGITVDIDERLPDEGYQLRIGPGHLRITAGGEAGAFYAAQTIRQLLPDEAYRAAPVPGPPWQLPCAEIDDAPALSWRGAHLDVARHFFPKPELLSFIDMLAAHKLNRFHLHLTDDQGWRIESERYPALHQVGSHRPRTRIGHGRQQPAVYDDVPHGGYYTLADLAEISAYAAAADGDRRPGDRGSRSRVGAAGRAAPVRLRAGRAVRGIGRLGHIPVDHVAAAGHGQLPRGHLRRAARRHPGAVRAHRRRRVRARLPGGRAR